MKNNIYKIALVLSAFLLTIACNEDDATDYSSLNVPSPALNVSLDFDANQTFIETDGTYGFTVTLSEPQVVNVVVYLSASGSATEGEDFDFPHSLTISAGSTSISDVISIYRDTDAEPTEDLTIQIATGFESNVSPNNGQTVSFTLLDYVFCSWILEASDTYGDGWNGGSVEVTSEGVTTQYVAPEEAGPGEITVYDIVITDGADYSFTYITGGGTGAGPGWESENYYKLTAPDGTVWEDGTMDYSGIPTPGLITSGTNDCP